MFSLSGLIFIRALTILLWVLFFTISYYSLKRLMDSLPSSGGLQNMIHYAFTSIWFYAALFSYPLTAFLVALSLKIMPISSAGPVFLVLGSIISILLGMLFFSENISFLKWTGIFFCALGIILTTISKE